MDVSVHLDGRQWRRQGLHKSIEGSRMGLVEVLPL